jgi:hypothetical protein
MIFFLSSDGLLKFWDTMFSGTPFMTINHLDQVGMFKYMFVNINCKYK